MYDSKRKWRWIKTSMENKYKKFTLNSQCGWWGHDSKNIFCPTRVHCSILWRHISYHKATTWLHDSSVGGKTGIFFQPRDLGHWISLNLTLQWGYTSFVHHHGHRRWHNRWSWDGFTRITLGSLRALIASKSRRPLISLRTSRSLWSLGPSWPMFSWGTRPSSSSPDSLGTMRHAGEVTHHKFNFPFYVLSTNDLTDVWFLVYIFGVTFVTNLYFCNWAIIYVTLIISQWKNVLLQLPPVTNKIMQ